MKPGARGATAEAFIVFAAMDLGVDVYRACGEFRSDLIFDDGMRLLRVQCKSASCEGDVVLVRCRSCRRSRNGYVRRTYSANEIDAIAAWCRETSECYLLPPALFDGRSSVLLRLRPTRNNQRLRINWARDYTFAATLGQRGAIAQLGERLRGTQEVGGSSPPGSIETAASSAALF